MRCSTLAEVWVASEGTFARAAPAGTVAPVGVAFVSATYGDSRSRATQKGEMVAQGCVSPAPVAWQAVYRMIETWHDAPGAQRARSCRHAPAWMRRA